MWRLVLGMGLVGGCYAEHAERGAPEADDDVGEVDGDHLTGDFVPLAWVEDQSDLVEGADGVRRCVPLDPGAPESYGCRGEDDRCVQPSDRMVTQQDGGVIVYTGGVCAGEEGVEVWLDGAPVPPNLVIWTIELRFPAGTLVEGSSIDLLAAGASVALRLEEHVRVEGDECGHEASVTFNHEGDRWVLCREQWNTLELAVRDDLAGLIAPSLVGVDAYDPTPGGTVSLAIDVAGCDRCDSYKLGSDVQAVSGACCAPFREDLSWTVADDGIQLERSGQDPYISSSSCCPDGQIEDCVSHLVRERS